MDMPTGPSLPATAMVDPFGRHVTYLRVSVTDRCDFRCVYCMSEHMTFLPKKDLLSLEELDRVCSAFVAKGVRKLRITGGEPLVRKNILWLFQRPVAPPGQRRARRTDADHQRQPAAASSRQELDRCRRSAHQRLARHAQARPLQGHHALGRFRPGDGRHRCGREGRPQDQAQRRRAEGRQRGRVRRSDPLRPRPRLRPDPDRDHADGRDRRRPDGPVSAAVDRARPPDGSLDARGYPLPHRRPRALRARSRRPAGASASSRR